MKSAPRKKSTKSTSTRRNRSPNILLVHCHDLGRRLGCYGIPSLKTPVIDAFAAEGVLFENCFATAPLCSPSRGSLQTGTYPHRNGLMGLVNRGWSLPGTFPTLPELLRVKKYETLLFGLQHERKEPLQMGYDQHIHPDRPHTCDTVSAAFADWLASRGKRTRPFFASVGFWETHRTFKDPRYTPDDPATVHIPSYLPDSPEVREDMADLHGMVFAVDRAMATLLDVLKEQGQEDNTLVIFTTDHGIAFPRAKATLYDAGLETALLMRWPAGFEGGKRFPYLLSNLDLLPTILQCTGTRRLPDYLDGRSFLPLLQGKQYEPRTEIFAEKNWHDVYDPIRAIRTGKFKYIRNFEDQEGARPDQRPQLNLPGDIELSLSRAALKTAGDPHLAPRAEEELYDLLSDPAESNNVANVRAYTSTLTELRAALMRWLADTGDPILQGPIPCPDPPLQLR